MIRSVEHFGRVDFAFNNAGVFLDAGDVMQATEHIYDRTNDVDVRGVLYGMKHEIPAILASGGAIVNNARVQAAFTRARERVRLRESRLHLNGIGQHLSYASARTRSP